jgi:hypothetical protein
VHYYKFRIRKSDKKKRTKAMFGRSRTCGMQQKLNWVEGVKLKLANCDISFNNRHVNEDEKHISPQNGQMSEKALT